MVKKTVWKITYRANGNEKQDTIKGEKRKGKPTQRQAKNAILNKPKNMMVPRADVEIKSISKLRDIEDSPRTYGPDMSAMLPDR